MARFRGISMTEVLIILVIVGIAVVALLKHQSLSFATASESSNRAEAMRLGQQVLARFKAAGKANSGGDSVPGLNATYQRKWTAIQRRNPSRYDVEVAVSWTDRRNINQNVAVVGQVFGQSVIGAGRLAAPYAGRPPAKDTSPAPADGVPTEKSATGDKEGSGYTRTISGSIIASGKVSSDDAQITITQGGDCSSSGGSYTCTVPNGWSGDISFSSKTGAAISPATTSYNNTNANVSNQDVFLVKR